MPKGYVVRLYEFVGIPGSGKTKLADSLSEGGFVSSVDLYNRLTARCISELPVPKRSLGSIMPRALRARFVRPPDLVSRTAATFIVNNEEFNCVVLEAVHSIINEEDKIDALRWILHHWSLLAILYENAEDTDNIVLSEGLCQRLLSLLARGVEWGSIVERYLNAMPRMDGVIILEVPKHLAIARRRSYTPPSISRMIDLIPPLRDELERRDIPTAQVATDQPLESSLEEVETFIQSLG